MFLKRKENQRDGRDKNTVINKNYIESGEYRKKFDKITNDREINRLLYNCAKEMLLHRSGTLLEDMYWIEPISKKVVASETNQLVPGRIIYSRTTKKAIKKYKGLITIHSHPSSFPPSIDDFNSNYQNNYDVGIICAHNGRVFKYYSEEIVGIFDYQTSIKKLIKNEKDEVNVQMLAIEQISKKYKIYMEEMFG